MSEKHSDQILAKHNSHIVQSKYSGKLLYAIVFEEKHKGQWEAQPIKYIYADSQGEARWHFTSMQKVETFVLEIGVVVGFHNSGRTKLIHGMGVRADENRPILEA